MASNKILLLLLFITVCIVNASQELEDMIVKTDLEAVKKILPTVTLNSETKQHLIDLANDIILMRLKTEEIYSFKDISNQDEKNLKMALSKKTIEDIKQLNNTIGFWTGTFYLSLITACIGPIFTETRFDTEIVSRTCFTCFIYSFVGIFVATYGIVHNSKVLQNKIRSNLHQLYQDSIEIKHLITCMPTI